ncbi:MAG TPA: YigZ family protein [Dokdonella sp.]|uniref:IMPACT family protein n=1 Tax=Dokdonella sp. TaxID=2291710 RepID=UPI002D7F366D|nr:YigZ family protein [Dokdonella sp.]HET9032530.1 YigZ family protein [Dokdonella sp.]
MSVLQTLTGSASLLQEIRKSRFLANAEPVDDPDRALTLLAEISDPLATHNCWAYKIGQQYRFSDDSEPGGTAGRPILQAIEGQGVDQVIVVVTRWYGGTKLGAGGLARAYGGCAAECLRLAEKTPIIETVTVRIHCEFAELPILQARLSEFAAERIEENFDASGAALQLRLPRDQLDGFSDYLRDLTRGRETIAEPMD